MITYWLVVMISISGGDWIGLENVKMASRQDCIIALTDRMEKSEGYSLVDANHAKLDDEHEIAISCTMHWAEEKPL